MVQDDLEAVGRELSDLIGRPSMWPSPREAETSLLLQEFHLEWSLHYMVTIETLTESHRALIIWYAQSPLDAPHKDKLIALAVNSMRNATQTLKADNLEQFLELSHVILESVAKIFSLPSLTSAIEFASTISKVQAVIKSRDSHLLALDALAPMAEASMERMFLMALWVDSQVSAIVDLPAPHTLAQKSIADLKEPIVRRLYTLRRNLHLNAGFVSTRMQSMEGYWPAGLRADV